MIDTSAATPTGAVTPTDCVFKLQNQIKHYDWGSREFIPVFLGVENSQNLPWAEMWMGSHPGAPSMVEKDGNLINLGSLIAENPGYYLGKRGSEQYGRLPFLFKLIAAGKPLSIQAHPNKQQAREGFERENKAGLSIDDPKRNYKDPNHKPEILCALVPMTLMCGFREPPEILKFFEDFSAAAPEQRQIFAPILDALHPEKKSLEEFFRSLFAMTTAQRENLCGFILKTGSKPSALKIISDEQWDLMLRFAELYSGDPAVLSPLYLNVLTLAPGEAIFVRAGILHAYLSGFGVELMANSDNVLRGGLTSKHVDIQELLNILDFNPFMPQILKAELVSAAPVDGSGAPQRNSGSFRYPSACDEFSLSLMCAGNYVAKGASQGETVLSEEVPVICVVAEGELLIKGAAAGSGRKFKKGESFFIPAGGRDISPLVFAGNYRLYSASLGSS